MRLLESGRERTGVRWLGYRFAVSHITVTVEVRRTHRIFSRRRAVLNRCTSMFSIVSPYRPYERERERESNSEKDERQTDGSAKREVEKECVFVCVWLFYYFTIILQNCFTHRGQINEELKEFFFRMSVCVLCHPACVNGLPCYNTGIWHRLAKGTSSYGKMRKR